MLTSLSIRNFALIEELRVDFSSGLTIITGETGAGKSIIIDALSLVLGERADTTMIRDGAEKAFVEAEFISETLHYLQSRVEELTIEWGSHLLLRREISTKGMSRCFINDTPVSVAILKEIGDLLVDVHGQHQHQSLLYPEMHIRILDEYGNLQKLREEYTFRYNAFLETLNKLQEAFRNRETIHERKIVIEHQIHEITSVNPKHNEDEDIEKHLKIAEHAEKIARIGSEILEHLYDDEVNVIDSLGHSKKLLAELAKIDNAIDPLSSEVSSAIACVEEVARTIRSYIEKIDFNPDHCEQLRHRLSEINSLKRKYQSTLPELIEKWKALDAEYSALENIDESIETLGRMVEESRDFASTQAKRLTKSRKVSAKQLAQMVVYELSALGINNSRFETRIIQRPFEDDFSGRFLNIDGKKIVATETGSDFVEFHISTNIGEEVKPLAKIVSGGEVSRIMLALKTLFAGKSSIPVMVFDEIDVGVSGNIAQKVGMAMRKLSRHHQIVAITHLPQIAATGDSHLLVEKNVVGARTLTTMRSLAFEERAREIARLISGNEITDASMRNAFELMSATI